MEKELKVEYLSKKELKPYANNAKLHPTEQVEQIKKSIEEFSFNDPIAIWGDNEVVEGHGRLLAVMQMDDIEKVPVIRLDHLTDEERRAYMLVHNKLTMNTGFNDEILNMELGDISLDMSAYGFSLEVDDDDVEIIEDEPPEVKTETTTKVGDMFLLGDHVLMCGDSNKEEDVEKLLSGVEYKVLFTSPPYNMASGMYENYQDNKESQEYIEFNLNVFNKWMKHCKGYMFWNISYNKNSRWEFIEIIYRLIKESGMRFLELIVWDKGHGMPIVSKDMLTREYEDVLLMADEETAAKEIEMYYLGTTEEKAVFNKKKGKGISNYWRIGTHGTQLKNHKACNPVELSARAVRLCSDRGDIVADCFGGSGTTLISCEQLGRKCYTMELDPLYCDVIVERWENFTGKKAIKL